MFHTLHRAAVLAAAISAVIALGGNNAAAGEPEVAIVAGGCFWCVESDFDKVPGVLATISGYTGGHLPDPTYKDVTSETSGHREAVKIEFDPDVLSYDMLLDIFWRSVDPTDPGGQFCDRGESYTTAIFAVDQEQRKIAEVSKAELEQSGALAKPIATPILDAATFYPAEDYHQDYHRKNPLRYSFYRYNCGRDAQVEAVWGDEAHSGIPQS